MSFSGGKVRSAMILAAGRGERLRPYTDKQPKPLLEVNGKPVIFYHLEALASAGFSRVVINVSWLGEMIEQAIGDGAKFGLEVVYSREQEALETAGGIIQALELLGDQFVVVNGDVMTDYSFQSLMNIDSIAHLVLVKNPDFHPQGDFVLNHGRLGNAVEGRYTYAGIACFNRSFFNNLAAGKRALAPLFRKAAETGTLTGELYEGAWVDVGTLERWQAVSL